MHCPFHCPTAFDIGFRIGLRLVGDEKCGDCTLEIGECVPNDRDGL